MSHVEREEPRAGWVACVVFAILFAALAVWNFLTNTPWVGVGFVVTSLAWVLVALWRWKKVNAKAGV